MREIYRKGESERSAFCERDIESYRERKKERQTDRARE
jgi:hypothetical protein